MSQLISNSPPSHAKDDRRHWATHSDEPAAGEPTPRLSRSQRLLAWLVRNIPTAAVIAALVALGHAGHRTEWKIPKSPEFTGNADAPPVGWCTEHGVPGKALPNKNPVGSVSKRQLILVHPRRIFGSGSVRREILMLNWLIDFSLRNRAVALVAVLGVIAAGAFSLRYAECARCDSSLIAQFKTEGDWCEEHTRPESQCVICNPDAQEKLAARYEAKLGETPPAPAE